MNSGARVGVPAGLPSSAIGYSCRMPGSLSTRLNTRPIVSRSGGAGTAARDGGVGRVPELGVVDVLRSSSPPMSSCVMKLAVRSGSAWCGSVVGNSLPTIESDRVLPTPRFGAARRVAGNRERRAALAEIAGVAGLLDDPPLSDQAHAVGVHEAAKPFAIRAPSQVGARIEGSLACLREQRGHDSTHDASERDFVDRKRRFAFATPHSLIRIGEQRVDDIGEPRTGVAAVLVGQLFRRFLSRGCHSGRDYTHGPPLQQSAVSPAGQSRQNSWLFCAADAIRKLLNSKD